ncbi:hypothetical protein MLD38_032400 [Melastoma candidum]|uniref:Uncharacterized protein n=1 Tax=Melastoma candidum TaxID=119954 RepID=A0ACB9M3R5_9MYRT|nr:hypothetical protein MLD38_032400 [Melastoma candidum]
MGKQQKGKKRSVPDGCAASGGTVGKGQVTPVQVAFIVDRYLSDNGFTESRSVFRKEASSLIGRSPLHEAPEGLLSLDAMLNEYISLKEQKVAIDQDRASLDREKWRIQSLLQGMQQVMNVYNVGASCGPTTPAMQAILTKTTVVNLPADPKNGSPPGVVGCTACSTPSTVPLLKCSSSTAEPENAPLQSVLHPSSNKRKPLHDAVEATSASKRTRSLTSSVKLLERSSGSVAQVSGNSVSVPSIPRNSTDVQIVTGSGVVKRLFNLSAASSPVKSSGPITPPREISSRSGEECTSSSAVPSVTGCSNANTPHELTPSRCTVISYEKVTMSPYKYTIERSQCVASSSPAKVNSDKLNRRDHVKGRLDFDEPTKQNSAEVACVTTSSPSEEDRDIFDWDFPDLGSLGNFSFSELLVDLDLGFDNQSDNPTTEASPETFSGSSHESRETNVGPEQFIQECSTTVAELISSDSPGLQQQD